MDQPSVVTATANLRGLPERRGAVLDVACKALIHDLIWNGVIEIWLPFGARCLSMMRCWQ